jgi:hypothetical protein
MLMSSLFYLDEIKIRAFYSVKGRIDFQFLFDHNTVLFRLLLYGFAL